MGGLASGEARRKKASIRDSLNKILTSGFKLPDEIQDEGIKDFIKKLQAIGVDTKNMELADLMNCGQILSAIGGKSESYKTLLETNGENVEEINSTPIIEKVEEVVDNSNLEKELYEANKHNEDVKGQ